MPELASCEPQLQPSCQEATLRERLAAVEQQRDRAERSVFALGVTLDEVVKQCVALERLCGTVDHREVLRAVQDVVVNLVGSEELAIFELSADGSELAVTQSLGVAGARLAPIRIGEGLLGRAAAEGRAWLEGDGTPLGDPDLHAWVPLLVEGSTVAALAVWKLLPHKPALGDADRRVLRLLGAHAGNALYLTDPRRFRGR